MAVIIGGAIRNSRTPAISVRRNEAQSQQPPGTEREHQHGQRSEHEDQW